MGTMTVHPESRAGDPWFLARPRWTLAVAAGLFVAVLVLRMQVGTTDDAISMLYTLPIALLALTFGRKAGVAAGVLGVALVGLWGLLADADISLLGWVARVTPLLMLGFLLGDASDRLSAANARRRDLEAAAQRQLAATEVNDTLVQGMSAAMWSLESGRHESGMSMLRETLELGHQLVSRLLRDSHAGPGGRHRPTGHDSHSSGEVGRTGT